MKNSIFKIISVSAMFWVLQTGPAFAMFSDTETSGENEFQAGTLDLVLTTNTFSGAISPAGEISASTVFMNEGTVASSYNLILDAVSGNSSLCEALSVQAKRNGVEEYDDLFLGLKTATSTVTGTWKFNFSLPPVLSGVAHGDVCEADIVFRGWQENATFGEGGFSDEERLHVKITAKMIVLNEFLPNPEGFGYGFDFGADGDSMPQGEWVELYNMSDTEKDLAGWKITDNGEHEIFVTSDRTGNGSTVIPAKGWLVVYMNHAVLNNGGDTVMLYDAENNLVDSYEYSPHHDICELDPTPGELNDDAGSGGTTGCGGVPKNKSYARIPDGIGDWVDPIPTPGDVNELENVATENGTSVSSGVAPEAVLDTEDETVANTEGVEEGALSQDEISSDESVIEESAQEEVSVAETVPVTEPEAVEEEIVTEVVATTDAPSGDSGDGSTIEENTVVSEPVILETAKEVTE